MPAFKYVFIPADVDEEVQELTMEYTSENVVECLVNRLQKHFARHKKTTAQEAQFRNALRSKAEQGTTVSDELLDTAVDIQLAETVPLVVNRPANRHVGIDMYVDDQGVLKGLPVNVRASQVAQLCGLALEVRGDAFLARFRDNDDDFERMDFSLAELSSSAPWVAEARAFQEDKRRRGDTTEAAYERLMSGVGAGARAGAGKANKDTINTEAQREKERGNEEFRAGRWGSAVECYSRAVEADPGLTAALSNRAMALIKLGRYADALADCERVVGANTGDVKGLLRRATCYRELGRAEEARRDYERVLNMQPRNKDALSGLDAMGVQPDTATP